MGKPKSVTVKDVNTGELYRLYDIPGGSWPSGSTPRIVFECGVCKGRFPAEEWGGGCPGCKKAKDEKPKDDAKPRRRWTLTQD